MSSNTIENKTPEHAQESTNKQVGSEVETKSTESSAKNTNETIRDKSMNSCTGESNDSGKYTSGSDEDHWFWVYV